MVSDDTTGERDALTFESVFDALVAQIRVIHALVLRETKTRYGEHKIGFLWAFIEPLMFVAIMAAVFSSMHGDSPGGMPVVTFMISGFVPFVIFRDLMQQMQGAIAQNRSLLAFPQVTTFDVIVARGVLDFLVLLTVFGVLLGGAALLGFEVRVENPLMVLLVCMLLGIAGAGAGFLFASLTPLLPSVKQIASVVLGRPLFLSSGVFFTADSLPLPLRDWLLYNPIMHLIELGRSAFFHEFESTHASWSYALGWVVGLFAFGLIVHQAVRRRAVIGI